MMQRKWVFTAFMATISSLCLAALASAEPYELSKNDLTDPKAITSQEISLFGVKLGDAEGKALDVLVNEKIAGIKAEQEATFIFLLDQRKPTGPMAGVRVQDGKVDLIFINNRFAYKTRGIFRNVLNSESPDDVRKLLGQGRVRRRKCDGRGARLRQAGFSGQLPRKRRQRRVRNSPLISRHRLGEPLSRLHRHYPRRAPPGQ